MGDNYQLRKDIDKLYDMIYDRDEEDLNVITKSAYDLDRKVLDERLDLMDLLINVSVTREDVLNILREYNLIE